MNYVVAACRELYADTCERLNKITGDSFTWLSDPAQLTVKRLQDIKPQRIFFPHWSSRIPEAIYGNFDCVIFHMTDVPFGRGGSPLQNLIVRGFSETVMTAMQCSDEIDAGPVFLKRKLLLDGNAQEIYVRARDLIEEMIVEIIHSNPQPLPQSSADMPVLFERRRPEDGNIASLDELQKIYDYIRMLDADGYPHAYLETDNLRIEFNNASMRGNDLVCSAVISMRDKVKT